VITKRAFIKKVSLSGISLTIPISLVSAALPKLKKKVKLGLIADLHQDVMHDAPKRLAVFLDAMKMAKPDGVIQMGDFAIPKKENTHVIDAFNKSHPVSLHVIGNHDTDHGFSKQQCLDAWGMEATYYSKVVKGIRLVVLDGNEKGSPTHKGGYVSYIGKKQSTWLNQVLTDSKEPIIVISHQPLAGAGAVDNAKEIQQILTKSADKVMLSICGHMHINHLVEIEGIPYLNINSASYLWVGGKYKHPSYSEEVHKKHPYIDHTCPYKDALYTTLTIDPDQNAILIEERKTEWVGKSPKDLGMDFKDMGLDIDTHIVPAISARKLT